MNDAAKRPRRNLRFFLAVAFFAAGAAPLIHAEEKNDASVLLGRALISPHLALREVQTFTAARVTPMPAVKSLDEWEGQARRLRAEILERVVFRGEAAVWRDARTRVEWLDTIPGGPGYRIKKLRYEALPGVWIPALLYEPEKLEGQVPVHLALNGHARPLGKAVPYKQIRCINLVKRGMIVLSPEWLAMGQLRTDNWDHDRLKQIDLCGSSGLAPFYLCMQRGLDVLLSLEHADPRRVAISGESGGGWQSIFLGALDTRVTLANPVAGYGSLREGIWSIAVGDSEQVPCEFAAVADYCHLTALMAPRPTLLTYNSKDDCCFVAAQALPPLLEAAEPIFRFYGRDNELCWHINHDPGTHNYDKDNRQALYRMIGVHFFPGDRAYDAAEIPCEGEVKSPETLSVDLPTENGDFHTLALGLCGKLPRELGLPGESNAARRWQPLQRKKLREIVRARNYDVQAIAAGSENKNGLQCLYWWIKMDNDWTVPVVELIRERAGGSPKATAILVADEGRASAADDAERMLAAGYRVLAVDPFGLGESKVYKLTHPAAYRSEFVHAVESVGERSLGIQGSQLAAIARWSRARRADERVEIVAVGPRAGACALVAAALEDKAVSELELHGSLGSLKEVIEENWTAAQKPEIFCFGLLEYFDIKQLAALVAPRPVVFVAPSPRAKEELTGLRAWYQTLGNDFEPLR